MTIELCVAIDLAQLTMNFDRRYALCIQKFIKDRTSQSVSAGIRASIFNRCYCENLGCPTSYASCDVITLSCTRMYTCNKSFTKLEGGQSGTYLRQTRASSGPGVSVTKTYRDETKQK